MAIRGNKRRLRQRYTFLRESADELYGAGLFRNIVSFNLFPGKDDGRGDDQRSSVFDNGGRIWIAGRFDFSSLCDNRIHHFRAMGQYGTCDASAFFDDNYTCTAALADSGEYTKEKNEIDV